LQVSESKTFPVNNLSIFHNSNCTTRSSRFIKQRIETIGYIIIMLNGILCTQTHCKKRKKNQYFQFCHHSHFYLFASIRGFLYIQIVAIQLRLLNEMTVLHLPVHYFSVYYS